MTNPHIERANHLLQTDRADEAASELRQALSQNPDDVNALALLAQVKIIQSDYPAALELAKDAVGKKADSPFLFLVLGKAFFVNKDLIAARNAVDSGIQLAPNMAAFYRLLSEMAFYESKWTEALMHANHGLEIDPENVGLINLRAQALVKLNRQDEAAITLDYALNRAPENSTSHANQGWVAIEQDRYDEAIKNFLEALRLNPTDEYARHGLKEAIKGKNLIYRGLLKYFLWMDKMQEKYQWGFIIGIYLAYRAVLSVAENIPALAPFLYPIIMLYIIFAFSTWIAKPISNLFLRLHPIGKHALSEDEKTGSNVAGSLLAVCLVSLALYFITGNELTFRIGLVTGIMLIPAGGAYSVPPGNSARRGLLGVFIALLFIGAYWAVLPDQDWAFFIVLGGIFLYGWVANYFIGKAAKEF